MGRSELDRQAWIKCTSRDFKAARGTVLPSSPRACP